jgi:CRISPR-associated endonuclease/helicase Cas3
MIKLNFQDWFKRITGNLPFPYQEKVATNFQLSIFLLVLTGAGKTAAVVLGWLWRRRYAAEEIRKHTSRRLVYCLPMRTLVEQTYTEVENWLKQAGLAEEVELHMLMGGAVSQRWEANPEKDMILIGTQDQLLSRALNRGYSMSRYRWSMHFALLNNDCLWVMDEVQLMGPGLKTTAQLQGFREIFGTYGSPQSLWMSATLHPELLKTVDYQPDSSQVQELTDEDRNHPTLQMRLQARKQLLRTETTVSIKEDKYAKDLATEVVKAHTPGTLTLVICNRVSRAQEIYKALQKEAGKELLPLIHAGFRASERKTRQELFQRIQRKENSGILVSTQAIEAGVDISAKVLFIELAPWSSLVQRIGRNNRYGEWERGEAKVYWIDIDLDQKGAPAPYTEEQLLLARSLLEELDDVGPASLQQVQAPLEEVEGLIPRQRDLLELFDTSVDLAGHDIDISPFIRESDDTDVAIAWRDWQGDSPPNDSSHPDYQGSLQRDELCRVSLIRAREFFKKQKCPAWVFDRLQGKWQKISAEKLYPGIVLLLHCSAGGYSTELGFTGLPENTRPVPLEQTIEPERDDTDLLSQGSRSFVSLIVHAQDVAVEVQQLCSQLQTFGLPVKDLVRAGRWHDAGKAHPEFQKMLTYNRPEKVGEQLWAKSDHDLKSKEDRYSLPSERRGFRHELVSALLALQGGEEFLLIYLIGAHHGKVRMTIQPHSAERPPKGIEQYALGVHQGDEVPFIDLGEGLTVPPQRLSLDCMKLGESNLGEESWTARARDLLNEYGPFELAFLEMLIRVADWRASAKYAENILSNTDD